MKGETTDFIRSSLTLPKLYLQVATFEKGTAQQTVLSPIQTVLDNQNNVQHNLLAAVVLS